MAFEFKIPVYACEKCGDTNIERQHNEIVYDDDNGTLYHKHCWGKCEYHHTRFAEWVSIGAYRWWEEYGGPEEGGWMYRAGGPIRGTIREFKREDFPQAHQYELTLLRRYAHERSVMVRTLREQEAAAFPETTPRYR